MGLSIMTNALSQGAKRNLDVTNQRLETTIRRLSSGSRIVQASDDPAGLAISDGLTSTIRSQGQAVRNAQDGISLIQVYEGGTNEINNALTRIRELAIQASSETVGDRERVLLNNEVFELKSEVTRIAETTRYAGYSLLNGEAIDLEFQVGVNNNPEVDRIRFAPGSTALTAEALDVGDIDVSDKEGARDSLDLLDSAITRVNEIRARIGSAQSRLNTTIQAQQIYMENLSSARSRIRDADVAEESSNMTRDLILRKAGVAVLTQANETPMLALQLLGLG